MRCECCSTAPPYCRAFLFHVKMYSKWMLNIPVIQLLRFVRCSEWEMLRRNNELPLQWTKYQVAQIMWEFPPIFWVEHNTLFTKRAFVNKQNIWEIFLWISTCRFGTANINRDTKAIIFCKAKYLNLFKIVHLSIAKSCIPYLPIYLWNYPRWQPCRSKRSSSRSLVIPKHDFWPCNPSWTSWWPLRVSCTFLRWRDKCQVSFGGTTAEFGWYPSLLRKTLCLILLIGKICEWNDNPIHLNVLWMFDFYVELGRFHQQF